jgi:hypothetical protein
MRKPLKVAAWAALFLACAGVGAYIAAHSDPFPPGVDRPGGSNSVSVSPSGSPTPAPVDRWVGSLRSFTYHQLYVGGRCTTRWTGRLRFNISDTGSVQGRGVAHLVGGLVCDFPIAQVQVRRVAFDMLGRLRGTNLTLRLEPRSIQPVSARDYGGFVALLPVRITLPVRNDAASGRVLRRKVDEEGRGIYFWSTGFQLARIES